MINIHIAYRSTKCYQNEKIIHIVSYSSKHHKLFKFTSYQAVKMKGKNVEINFPGRVRSWIMDVVGCCQGSSHSKKKSVKFHTWGGGQDKIGSFLHFFLFFFFYVLNHANLQRNCFLVWGLGYPLT